jgi:hypothetical protein
MTFGWLVFSQVLRVYGNSPTACRLSLLWAPLRHTLQPLALFVLSSMYAAKPSRSVSVSQSAAEIS